MEYYLVRLSYTPAAWGELVRTATTLDERLEPVRRLLRQLGGSLATHRFFDTEHSRSDLQSPLHVEEKFAMLSGHDLVTILAVPDKETAHAFNMALSAEPGLAAVDLAPLLPWGEAIKTMATVRSALQATGYAAPARGGSK